MQNRCIPVSPQPYLLESRRNVVYIVTPDLTHQSSNPGRRTFSSLQTGPGPYHASTSVGTKVLSPGVKRPERDVEHSHFHLLWKLRLSGAIPSFPCIHSWRVQEQLQPIFFFDFHITRQQQFVYFNAVSTTVRILAVRVLGKTGLCILNSYVSGSALNTRISSVSL